jgi:O-glycosyl hydrolase
MAWGYYGNANNSFSNFISGLANGGAKAILGFNEPDSSSQSNLSVSSALQAWGLMQGASNGVPLVSPACVDDTDSWMQSFMSGAAAAGYRVDAVAIHWYGGDDPTGFINYVNAVHNLYNKPIWITEFCPADWSGNGGVTVADATSFMETVVPELESMSYVQRFSWFSAAPTDPDLGQGALFNSDGSLTALGSIYSRL